MALSVAHSRCAARAPASSTHSCAVRTPRRVIVRAAPAKVTAGPVTDDTWEAEVLNNPLPVLVDFWAPWCGPCRMIAPLIDDIASEQAGKLVCLKLNTDESPGVATEYGIRSIPTVMLFKGGKKVETIIGAVPKTTMEQAIMKYL